MYKNLTNYQGLEAVIEYFTKTKQLDLAQKYINLIVLDITKNPINIRNELEDDLRKYCNSTISSNFNKNLSYPTKDLLQRYFIQDINRYNLSCFPRNFRLKDKISKSRLVD